MPAVWMKRHARACMGGFRLADLYDGAVLGLVCGRPRSVRLVIMFCGCPECLLLSGFFCVLRRWLHFLVLWGAR